MTLRPPEQTTAYEILLGLVTSTRIRLKELTAIKKQCSLKTKKNAISFDKARKEFSEFKKQEVLVFF